MKLGIFFLIFGLLIAGIGVFAWTYADPNVFFWRGYGDSGIQTALAVDAAGLGAMVFGGGLAIGGIVRMLVKR